MLSLARVSSFQCPPLFARDVWSRACLSFFSRKLQIRAGDSQTTITLNQTSKTSSSCSRVLGTQNWEQVVKKEKQKTSFGSNNRIPVIQAVQRNRKLRMRYLYLACGVLSVVGNADAFSTLPRDRRSLQPFQESSTRQSPLNGDLLWALYARPKRRRRASSPPSQPLSEIPANLRRKVQAKRPALGHIVPAVTKVPGSGGSANPRLRPQGKAREAGLNNPSMLKIAGGSAKGRRLDSPDVYLRPMMGKVREAIYSTFTAFGLYDVDNTRHLDVFAGSGSVGLESLSRGAAHCTFVDLSDDCCSAIERNVKWCQFEGQAHVVTADALTVFREPASIGIPADSTFQIVTLCPPYEEVVYGDLLEAVATSDLITDDTVVLVEYPVELGCLPHVIPGKEGSAMVGVRNRRYGRTVIAMYINNPTGKLSDAASSRPEEFVEI